MAQVALIIHNYFSWRQAALKNKATKIKKLPWEVAQHVFYSTIFSGNSHTYQAPLCFATSTYKGKAISVFQQARDNSKWFAYEICQQFSTSARGILRN